MRLAEFNCRGGTPWPPVFGNAHLGQDGRPRSAVPAVAFLILLSFLTASAQVPLSPPESRGKEIYLLGTSIAGRNILAYIGDESMEVPGSAMACANCHGLSGQGKPEGGIDPSNITWKALSKPYGVTHS